MPDTTVTSQSTVNNTTDQPLSTSFAGLLKNLQDAISTVATATGMNSNAGTNAQSTSSPSVAIHTDQIDSLLQSGNFDAACALILSDRANLLDNQLTRIMKDMSDKNTQIKSLNDQISTLMAQKAGLTDSDADKAKATDIDAQIQQLKGQQDQLNGMQQQTLIQIQQVQGKSQQSWDLLSTLVKAWKDMKQTPIQNMAR